MKTPEELMDFMNLFSYGWKDKNGEFHIETLKDFKNNYVVMNIEDIYKNKIGTCIEQSNFQKAMLSEMGYDVKMFTLRRFNLETSDEVRMHCFTIYQDKNKWVHFEHANPNMRGICEYSSYEECMKTILDYFRVQDNGNERILNEVDYIPDGLSFSGVLDFLNNVKIK